jgi:predicted nucleic acid-binding protein
MHVQAASKNSRRRGSNHNPQKAGIHPVTGGKSKKTQADGKAEYPAAGPSEQRRNPFRHRKRATLMRVVVDTSYFIEFLSAPSEIQFLWILDAELVTASLFSYEFYNVMLKGLKVDLINLSKFHEILDQLKMKYIDIRGQEKEIYRMAAEQNLSFYDASYLWVAADGKMPLATRDKQLLKAADALKMTTIE